MVVNIRTVSVSGHIWKVVMSGQGVSLDMSWRCLCPEGSLALDVSKWCFSPDSLALDMSGWCLSSDSLTLDVPGWYLCLDGSLFLDLS